MTDASSAVKVEMDLDYIPGISEVPGGQVQGLSTSVPLSDASTCDDSSVNESPEKMETTEGKSTITVLFKDWVPATDTAEMGDSEDDPFSGGRTSLDFAGNRVRYFNVTRGNRKLRPGLGSNLEAYLGKSKSKPKKRKKSAMELIGDTENFSKRFKITPEKPASAILHEINPMLQYTFDEVKSSENPKALPTFTCTVLFPPDNGAQFTGDGRSKKLAKNDVAERILAFLGLLPPRPEIPGNGGGLQNSQTQENDSSAPAPTPFVGTTFHNKVHTACDIDFSSDDIINVNFMAPVIPALSQPMVDSNVLRRLRNIPNFEENICLVLNTLLFPATIEYENLGEEGPPHEKTFSVKVCCNMQDFTGHGGSKKRAKADAAKQAVIALLGEDCYKSLVENSQQLALSSPPTDKQECSTKNKGGKKKRKPPCPDASSPMQDEDNDEGDDFGEYDLNFSDHISNCVREKYEELIGKDTNFSPYKVLAGVVMTTGSPMIYNSTVIAVTTGTKCLSGEYMSEQGLAVNDCHAEILATRCVRDFLYNQIELFLRRGTDKEKLECIFENDTTPESQIKCRLKSGIKFHLFISTSPCGDARIFSPKGIELEDDQPSPSPSDLEDSHPNKLNRGVLRSKIEAGEGTIPSANLYSGPQTWDSIVGGSALHTMSCSDKVCRWNVLGLQGALLYNFVGAIYYSSITLGSLHHPVHFTRAVYGRVEPLKSRLEIPFTVHKPKLLMVSRDEKRKVKKSPNHAMCWSINWSTHEVLAANKGRCEPGGVASRLTKRMAFTMFSKLYNNDSGKREHYPDLTYYEAKHVAPDYQKAKEDFINYFKESKLGPWIGKPMEQDSFKIK